MKVDGRTRLGKATKNWSWAMWLGMAYWRADIKRAWECVSMEDARAWMDGWQPDEMDVEAFLADRSAMAQGRRHRFTMRGCVL